MNLYDKEYALNLEEAMERIKELEEQNRIMAMENAALTKELELYRGRNVGGRKKHDAAWMASYNDFAIKFRDGMTIKEIVAEGHISRRTAYRYKAYYEKLRQSGAYRDDT